MRAGGLTYRLRQLGDALRGGLDAARRAEAAARLGPTLTALFLRMGPADQRHCFAVYRKVLAIGCDDPELLRAALLHDVGKGRLPLPYRVAQVVLADYWPTALTSLAAESDPRSWRHPFFVVTHHAELGAQRLSEAGCDARLVEIVRRHHGPSAGDSWLERLQAADANS